MNNIEIFLYSVQNVQYLLYSKSPHSVIVPSFDNTIAPPRVFVVCEASHILHILHIYQPIQYGYGSNEIIVCSIFFFVLQI